MSIKEVTGEPLQATLKISDLRPMLGKLNWQLRRINKTIVVQTVSIDSEIVIDVTTRNYADWTVHCDRCDLEYAAGTHEKVFCPRCDQEEIYS